MKKFLLLMLAVFFVFIVVPSPVLCVVFLVCFLAPMNGWFALLSILLIPAIAISVLIMNKLLDADWVDEVFWW